MGCAVCSNPDATFVSSSRGICARIAKLSGLVKFWGDCASAREPLGDATTASRSLLLLPPARNPHKNQMCSHQGTVLAIAGCETACQGCEWTDTVSSTKQGTSCVFTWRVTRKNCDFQTNQTFSGTTTVPCDQTTKLTFQCDSVGVCDGYELTLIGDPCPTPPG